VGFAGSPDGKTLLVANHGDGIVSVVNLAEGRVVSTFMAGAGVENLAISKRLF
jgi:YVTN family beta-propeller protein